MVNDLSTNPDVIIGSIKQRIDRVFGKEKNSWATVSALPTDDPHIQKFLKTPAKERFRQGKVGYCFQPLVSEIYRLMKDDLSFVVLMYADTPQQRRPNIPMGSLNFSVLNNEKTDEESQLRFRKAFRFVGSEGFSEVSIQTSKILFERGDDGSDFRHYVYSFEIENTLQTDDLTVIPVFALAQGIQESTHFKRLSDRLRKILPEDISEEMELHFRRFHNDGDLEREVIEADPSSASGSQIIEINRESLAAFEELLITFNLKRSADLRRRFLNYFAWMLLCDSRIRSYSYQAAMKDGVPQAEIIIASRGSLNPKLNLLVRDIAAKTFPILFEQWNDNSGELKEQSPGLHADWPVTLDTERDAISREIESGHMTGDTNSASRKLDAILGLDDAILRYVGPIVSRTFASRPRHLSLDPFWSETVDGFPRYVADLTLQTLEKEYKSRDQLPKSRVNPFLMAMFPIANFLVSEMRLLRDYGRLGAATNKPASLFAPRNRLLGELPLHQSGVLSMNVVFLDIATGEFRYCSVSFIGNDPVFDHTFNVFFRLIDTVDPVKHTKRGSDRGVLDSVLLMSDVLFRESSDRIEPACIVFRESTSERRTQVPSEHLPTISVAEYIKYLDGEAREEFNKLYREILLEGEAKKEEAQRRFDEFCSDKNFSSGVWDFLNKPSSRNLIKRAAEFLERFGVEVTDKKKTVAKFLGYMTWLWLCYRDRVAYYYYIPAQLPFNERVGGFAIATEIPIPNDVLEFFFLSVAPRVAAHPALLHHREAVTIASQTIQQCWFDGLLHLIYNSYGLKELRLNLKSMIDTLAKMQQLVEVSYRPELDQMTADLKDSEEHMARITDLEQDLRRMFDDQISPDKKLVEASWLFEVCLRLSGIYAQKRGVTVVLSDALSSTRGILKRVRLHSPVLLVLWHVVLNACEAASELPSKRDRVVELDAVHEKQKLKIVVRNLAKTSEAERFVEKLNWQGLENDIAILRALWLDTLPGTIPDSPISVNIKPVKTATRVEVMIHAPASNS